MKIITIVCEYNPFHSGHKFQIDKLRDIFGQNCAIIAVMSGNLTQRGDVAVLSKYARAESAVACGCNLVLELPAPWSMAGAEFFARAGVSIANRLGCVDLLAFGSESADLDSLRSTAANLSSELFAETIRLSRRDNPDMQAGELRAEVYNKLYPKNEHFNGSNDLLALEYLSALLSLKSKIEPFALKRTGGSYNSIEAAPNKKKDAGFASATAIRRLIFDGGDFESQIPEPSAIIVRREIAAGRYYRLSNLDTAAAAFLRLSGGQIRGMMEVSGGIENRIHRAAMKFAKIDEIIAASLEKRYSASRIRRAIFASMIGFTMRDCEELPRYTSLLAADQLGRELLGHMRKCAQIPILSKPSAYNSLDEAAKRQFKLNISAESLHALAAENESERCPNLFAGRAIMQT